MNWYYIQNGQQAGPVSEAALAQLFSSGVVNSSTMVWREGLPDWQLISVALPGFAQAPQIGGVAVPAAQKDLYVQQMREGVASNAQGMRFGGFWIRFVARFVDGLILRAVGFVLGLLMAFMLAAMARNESGRVMVVVLTGLMGLTVNMLYEMIMVSKYGATLGKMALGLKIVRSDGGPVSMGLACGRFFASILSGMILAIGYIMAGFDDEKRALHDRICNTRVIKTK